MSCIETYMKDCEVSVAGKSLGREWIQATKREALLMLAWTAFLTTSDLNAADWPEHLTLHEASRSPDGHYGIVVTTSSHVDAGATVLLAEEGEEFVDYFADLQKHRLLGKIKNFEYVERQNHAHLDAEWTLKFDEAGNWKVIKTHQMSKKELAEEQ